MSTMLY